MGGGRVRGRARNSSPQPSGLRSLRSQRPCRGLGGGGSWLARAFPTLPSTLRSPEMSSLKLSMKAVAGTHSCRRVGSRFHKDNLRHLSRFSDLFVTLRILSAPPKTRESAKVHNKQISVRIEGEVARHDIHHQPIVRCVSFRSTVQRQRSYFTMHGL